MKSLNLKALYEFTGCVVDKILVEMIGVQVKMRRDRRCKPRCPGCEVVLDEVREGEICVFDLPVADKTAVWVTLPAVQGRCPRCGELSTPRPPEVHPTRNATWRLMRLVAAWASVCPASDVASMFEIGASTVRRYETDVLEADLPEPDLDGLEVLLVDEKSVRKGHGYVTVVLNGRTGELLHMAEGKKKESLESFLATLTREQKDSIRAVCIDRNGAYRSVLAEQLPKAEIVHDRFHIMANLNSAIDEVRRSEWRSAKAEGKKVIKGSRYLLMMNRENLDESGRDRLLEITRLNEKLSMAYILKEDFRAIYTHSPSVRSARARMRRWHDAVLASGIEPMIRFARGVMRDLKEVTAYFKHRVTSGRIEAFNNQIARLIHRACGMTNLKHLFLKMRAQSLKQI
ncbi:ISL3 family transposase [Haloferula sp. A504]|uniref:ISL3 family transposase n=1 Tax=Haloferula sp. A504 TaxID=3373601 RepID=UPI0031BF4480|nr:ISL3 family transposase [Verrucomicrobiaceae bacterium E54]